MRAIAGGDQWVGVSHTNLVDVAQEGRVVVEAGNNKRVPQRVELGASGGRRGLRRKKQRGKRKKKKKKKNKNKNKKKKEKEKKRKEKKEKKKERKGKEKKRKEKKKKKRKEKKRKENSVMHGWKETFNNKGHETMSFVILFFSGCCSPYLLYMTRVRKE